MGKTFLNNKGSVLIEAIVGISLVMVGILGIVSLLVKSSSFYGSASNQLKATYLAAESIETVKNVLDAGFLEYLSGAPNKDWGWLKDGWYYVDSESAGDSLSFLPADFAGPESADFLNLILNDPNNPAAGGIYVGSSSGGDPTIFRRVVNVTNGSDSVTGTAYTDVLSYVSWDEKGDSRQVSLQDRFYNRH
ncbi:MAG: hypothetical protein ABSE68_03460 [Minisyncoccia bacterium]